MEAIIPTKSQAYLYAESVFFRDFNDVDFYVEDTDQEELYFRILSRLFTGIRLRKIFPLGGKQPVIEHAMANQNGAPSIYLVDKDFDDLLGSKLAIPGLFYLDAYCIENYLFEDTAIAHYIVSESPKRKTESVLLHVQKEKWRETCVGTLRYLSLLFFLVQKHSLPGMANTSLPLARFSQRERWKINDDFVANYEREMRIAASSLGIDIDAEIETYRIPFEIGITSGLRGHHVPGKYIIEMLGELACKTYKFPGRTVESMSIRLAEYCTFAPLGYLHDRVRSHLKTLDSR